MSFASKNTNTNLLATNLSATFTLAKLTLTLPAIDSLEILGDMIQNSGSSPLGWQETRFPHFVANANTTIIAGVSAANLGNQESLQWTFPLPTNSKCLNLMRLAIFGQHMVILKNFGEQTFAYLASLLATRKEFCNMDTWLDSSMKKCVK